MAGKKNEPVSQSSDNAEHVDIAIVGGGIAGLYCALQLNRTSSVKLYESCDVVGGRISTRRYPDGNYKNGKTEFAAEFGPMRIEPEEQPLLRDLLLNVLDIKFFREGDKTKSPRLIDFPPYSSPRAEMEPAYPLSGEESEQKTPFDLIKLAFVRIIGRLHVQENDGIEKKNCERSCLKECLKNGREALALAAASRQAGWQSSFDIWISNLREEDYQNIREYAALDYDGKNKVPLWTMGFWNLLSDVMSHNAVIRLRDMGTFYHLISENPNAAEWLVFWLRGLRISDKFKGINQGMDSITRLMKAKIKAGRIELEYTLLKIEKADQEKIRLSFDTPRGPKYVVADRVIFALPKAPLGKIIAASNGLFDEIKDHIDAVYGQPLVKVFFIVKRRWWEEEHRANIYATRVPTRELHYWKSGVPGSKKGMIMIYTDRPGSAFWANYVGKTGSQDSAEWRSAFGKKADGNSTENLTELCNITEISPAMQTRRLTLKLIQYIKEAGVESVRESDIIHCGIRDWGREPYVGAVHVWRPERKSWESLAALSEFALKGATTRNIHICGEAYCDYNGFIEGSLRSAAHALHRVNGHSTETPWLCSCDACTANKNRSIWPPSGRKYSDTSSD